jgi:hypothetical protein
MLPARRVLAQQERQSCQQMVLRASIRDVDDPEQQLDHVLDGRGCGGRSEEVGGICRRLYQCNAELGGQGTETGLMSGIVRNSRHQSILQYYNDTPRHIDETNRSMIGLRGE